MNSIFMDESGYTGPNLLDKTQPFFSLASLNYSESRCKELLTEFFGSVSSEIKHPHRGESREMKKSVLSFLKKISENPSSTKINIIHKEYMLVGKLVDFIYAPALESDGINIYDQGQNNQTAEMLFHRLRIIAGESFYEDLLKRFQNMMRKLDLKSYNAFYTPLFEADSQKVLDEGNQEELDVYLKCIKLAHIKVGYEGLIKDMRELRDLNIIHSTAPLDFGPTAITALMHEWRQEIGSISNEITLIYDKSSAMIKFLPIWNALAASTNPEETVTFANHTLKFPLGVKETKLELSENWAGLQLADIIAGAANRWAKWHVNQRNPKDKYGCDLDKVITTLRHYIIGPSPYFIHETPPPSFPDSNSNYLTQVIVKSKLEAIQRLKEMGAEFFYIYRPE
jgi:Protein of unknown function (DUF3800)